jgi:ribosomal protein S6--L-glutamate ligase
MLGGFPVVAKIANSTLGNGVIRADSWPALLSLTDYLVAQGTDFILREYIDGAGSGRLMVIGDQVVGSLEYDNPPQDFRTNATSASHPRLTQFDPKVEALAVAAVQSVGVELGGVDVMFNSGGECFLLEMNIPCGFATFPKNGIDVPGMMIEHLITKSERLRNG